MSNWRLSTEIEPNYDGGLMRAKWLKGGVRTVKTLLQRNGIGILYRYLDANESTVVFVENEGNFYKLINNPSSNTTTDADWELIILGGISTFTPVGLWDKDNTSPILQDVDAAGRNGQFYFVTDSPTTSIVTHPGLFGGAPTAVVNGNLVVSVGTEWVVVASSVSWDSIDKPQSIVDYVNGIVQPHTHLSTDITDLAAVLDPFYTLADTADHTVAFNTVPDTAIIELEFLKQWYYTKSEIDLILDLMGGGGGINPAADYDWTGNHTWDSPNEFTVNVASGGTITVWLDEGNLASLLMDSTGGIQLNSNASSVQVQGELSASLTGGVNGLMVAAEGTNNGGFRYDGNSTDSPFDVVVTGNTHFETTLFEVQITPSVTSGFNISDSGFNIFAYGLGATGSILTDGILGLSSNTGILLQSSGGVVTSETRLVYSADFSGSYTDRTLVDKAYVLSLTGASGAWTLASGGTFTGPNELIGTTTNTLKFRFDNLGTTASNVFMLANDTDAASGLQQISPPIVMRGRGWKTNATAASQTVDFMQYVLPVQGAANPTANWVLQSSINGAAFNSELVVTTSASATTLTIGWSGASIFSTSATNLTVRAGGGTLNLGANGTNSVAITNTTLSVTGTVSAAVASVNAGSFATTGTNTSNSAGVLLLLPAFTMRATSADDSYVIRTLSGSSITTGATNQTISYLGNLGTYTINHTGATVRGYYFAPTINGSQTPTHVYALQATTGKIGLSNTTNPTLVAGDIWMESGSYMAAFSGVSHRIVLSNNSSPIGANLIAYGVTGVSVTGSTNFTYDGTLQTINRQSLGATLSASSIGLALTNTTAAIAGTQQISPAIRLRGQGWKTDATAESRTVDYYEHVLPVQGAANPSGLLIWSYSINGAAPSTQMILDAANARLHFGASGGSSAALTTAGGFHGVEFYASSSRQGYLLHNGTNTTWNGNTGVSLTIQPANTTTAVFTANILALTGRQTITAATTSTTALTITSAVTAGANIPSGILLNGSYTVQSSSSITLYQMLLANTISVSATTQTHRAIANTSTYTVNFTGASIVGNYFGPTIGGSQTPDHVYALQATTGKIGLGTYNNANVADGDFWYDTSSPAYFRMRMGGVTYFSVVSGSGELSQNQVVLGSGTHIGARVTSSANLTFNGSNLGVTAKISQTFTNNSDYAFYLTRSGTPQNGTAGLVLGGSFTLASTSGGTYASLFSEGSVTTSNTNQLIYEHQNTRTYTVNNTGVSVVHSYFGPTINGSQTPSHVYALKSTVGAKIGLTDYTNSTPAAGDLWFSSGVPLFYDGSGALKLLFTTTPVANGIYFANSASTGWAGTSANLTFGGSTLALLGRFQQTTDSSTNAYGIETSVTGTHGAINQYGYHFIGSSTLNSNTASQYKAISLESTITSGANGTQSIHGFADTSTYTLNHTGAKIYGYAYMPTVNGSQTPTEYAIFTARGSILFGASSSDTITANTRFDIRGKGTSSSTTALRIADSANTQLLIVCDDGLLSIGGSATVTGNVFKAKSSVTAGGSYTGTFEIERTSVGGGGNSNIALYAYAKASNSSGTVTSIAGGRFDAISTGAGGVDDLVGVQSTASSSSSNAIDRLIGYSVTTDAGTATVNTTYGLFVSTPTVTSGSIGSRVGVYVQDPLSQSIFAGRVGIGAGASSTVKLHVTESGSNSLIVDLQRTGGTATEWELYIPSGSSHFIFKNASDRFGFTSAGKFFLYNAPANDDALTQILARDAGTGEVKYRSAASLLSAGGSVKLSALLGSDAINSIDNVNYQQSWSWNSLDTTGALRLSTTSTAMTNGTNLFRLVLSGTLASGNMYAQYVDSSVASSGSGTVYGVYSIISGNNNLNVGLYGEATGGSNNWGLYGRVTGNATNTAIYLYGGSTALAINIERGVIKFQDETLTYFTDFNNNELLKFSRVASAVNEITISNAATNNAPGISATGGDTHVSLSIIPKGTQGNISLLAAAGSYGGGQKVVAIADATSAPGSNPTGGGVAYSESGQFKWRTSGGVIQRTWSQAEIEALIASML